MNIRKLIFGLISFPFVLPIVFVGFLCKYITASFQVGKEYAQILARWIEKG